MLATLVMCMGLVHAGTVRENVDAARDSLAEKDVERAMSLLAQARMSVGNEAQLLDAATIAQLVYLEGLGPRIMGAERERDVDKWRSALVIFPKLQWDRELLDDKALRGFFEALRAETSQREPVSTQVPAKRGMLKAYVDGVEHTEMQAVRAGSHVAQVQCPDGIIRGAWTEFSEEFDWIGLCPNGVDLSVATPVAEEDEFALDDDNPRAGPGPLAWTAPVAVPVVKPVRAQRTGPVVDKRVLLIGAATGLAVSGVTYVAALMARGKYDDLSTDGLNSPSELKRQRKKTNGLVYVSGVFGVAGAGMGVAATFSGDF